LGVPKTPQSPQEMQTRAAEMRETARKMSKSTSKIRRTVKAKKEEALLLALLAALRTF
jgi:F420-dependent methylenetetrahydromethanopterin dehydrogenase